MRESPAGTFASRPDHSDAVRLRSRTGLGRREPPRPDLRTDSFRGSGVPAYPPTHPSAPVAFERALPPAPTVSADLEVPAAGSGYRWGFVVLSYGLLVLVVYRSFVLREASWELLALVLAGGLATTLYDALRVERPLWWRVARATTAIAALGLASWIAGLLR